MSDNLNRDKELVIEIRVKWDDLIGRDQLDLLSIFTDRAESAIKRKVVDEIADRIANELPTPEIDLSDLKERIKKGIVERKIDEVLDD